MEIVPITRQLEDLTVALADRYRLDRMLGSGGMATVYLAHDLKHGRLVAIKVLRPELAASIGADRFLSEIRTTARLTHPHILALHDSGDAAGSLFYVMPYIEGESIRDRLDRDKVLPIEEAVRITCQVGDALAYAHARQVIHRDIKPGNILLQAGHALVADFGIARAVLAAGTDRMTVVGMVVGTPAYMSPEQATGEREINPASDQYALASVLFEMLTGEPPFTGPTAQSLLGQRLVQPPPRVTLKRPAVPRTIEKALCTALAIAPEDRFATVKQFTDALTTPSSNLAEVTDRSIAVMPFTNMSGDPENDYFSEGMSEEILNALTQVAGLRVAARTSAFFFKGKNADLRTIGDQLKVSAVLEGSVRRAGNRLRITVQLIDVASGFHLWSERYDRELTDVFAIQDEIARVIAAKLSATLGPRTDTTLVRPTTRSVEAYDYYLKGRALLAQRGPAMPQAVDSLERAVKLDPDFAPALAELAEGLLLLGLWGMSPMAEVRVRAADATARALERDPTSATAHIALALLAFLLERDREKAARAWARAVELDSSKVEARMFRAVFDLCYVRGAFDEAVAELRETLALDPLSVHARAWLAITLSWAGRFREAAAEAERGVELDPNNFFPRWALLHALALGAHPAEGMRVGAEMLTRFGRHPWILYTLALASGAAGRHDLAEAHYAELEARSRSEYVQPHALAAAALGAGRREDVFRHLQKGVQVSDPLLAIAAGHWPGFASMRADPEFEAVLKQMGWDRPIAAGVAATSTATERPNGILI